MSILAGEVKATSPSIPAVLRPALRCVACRTLVQLVAGAIDQHHPGATVGRVTLGGLVEDRPNDLLAWSGDRAGQPLGSGVGAGPAGALAAAAPGRWRRGHR